MAVAQEQIAKAGRRQPLVVGEQFEQWFEEAAEVLRALDIPVDEEHDSSASSVQATMAQSWNSFRGDFMAIDYSRLSIKQQRHLRKMLNFSLPKFLKRYTQSVVKKGHDEAHSYWCNSVLLSFLLGAARGIAQQQKLVDHQQRYQSALALAATKTAHGSKQIETPKVHMSTQTHLDILTKIRTFDSGLGEATHVLLRDWKQAYGKAVGVEDRYRLEQVVNEHLPEIARLLPGVSEASKAEAVALIGEQLNLLHAQVKKVLAQHEVDSMTALRTQTSFIRALAANAAPSHLVLEGTAMQEIGAVR